MPLLPPHDDPLVTRLKVDSKSVYIAYNDILVAECETSKEDVRRLMHIRILGNLLIHAPNETARVYVAGEISGAVDGGFDTDRRGAISKLDQLGKMCFDHLIRLFRRNKGRTPEVSEHSSRPSLNEQRRSMKELVGTPHTHSGAKQNALIRDGFRCMLTGKIEYRVWEIAPTVFPASTTVCSTNCCHIMPESTNNFSAASDPNLKIEWASGVWTILDRFGYGNIRKELQGTSAHWLGNVLTLRAELHMLFDDLTLCFEKVPDQEHTYNVRCFPPDLISKCELPKTVRFTVHHVDVPSYPRPEEKDLPLPSPQYLELHAACCKVARMSGAADHLDEVVRDMESIGVLAEDGGSTDVLAQAIISRLVAPI